MKGGAQVVVCKAALKRGAVTGWHDLEEGDTWTAVREMIKWAPHAVGDYT